MDVSSFVPEIVSLLLGTLVGWLYGYADGLKKLNKALRRLSDLLNKQDRERQALEDSIAVTDAIMESARRRFDMEDRR